jgi:hypothetical protein
MKLFPYLMAALIVVCNSTSEAAGIGEDKRFEISGYLNMFSYGKNIILQTDIVGGINILEHLNLSIGSNIGYRNYSLTTNDYLSVSFRKRIDKNEFRIGAIGGIYTLWFSGYETTIPCMGGELLYSYAVTPAFSFRVKERISAYFDNPSTLISTSTLIGFCFSFGTRN